MMLRNVVLVMVVVAMLLVIVLVMAMAMAMAMMMRDDGGSGAGGSLERMFLFEVVLWSDVSRGFQKGFWIDFCSGF